MATISISTDTIAIQNKKRFSLSEQAEVVLKHRYFLKNKDGHIVEDSNDLFRRVAKSIASIEKKYLTIFTKN